MNAIRQLGTSLRFLIVITVILGIGYPVVSYGVGELYARHQIADSLVIVKGQVVGSKLIGQTFTGPTWFHSRPSAAGAGYDALSSGATNAGPNDPNLAATIAKRKSAVAQEEGVPLSAVPSDAITASGSGLDPDISVAYADLQAKRVAAANHLTLLEVEAKIKAATHHRLLGFIGEETVNVLKLNLSLSH
ncbi:MAG TPA: potassium-transporting ATPase subunit KdpC [Candidatus Nanopelagicaceae bacterium]